MSEAVVPHKADPSAPRTRFLPERWFGRAIDSDLFYSFRRSKLTMVAAAVTLLFFLLAISASILAVQNPFDPAQLQLMNSRIAPIWTADGPRSPGDPQFDPFWARVNEAGLTVVVHAGDSGYSSQGYAEDGFAASFGGGSRPTIKAFNIERAAHDFLITLVFEKLFDRFPSLAPQSGPSLEPADAAGL